MMLLERDTEWDYWGTYSPVPTTLSFTLSRDNGAPDGDRTRLIRSTVGSLHQMSTGAWS